MSGAGDLSPVIYWTDNDCKAKSWIAKTDAYATPCGWTGAGDSVWPYMGHLWPYMALYVNIYGLI